MKTKITTLALTLFAFTASIFAQDRTTVTATGSDISDNLDLKAVASIFGDSQNLEDFEQRLNDPKLQISNLDLNNDNQVDYLRVIESVEGRTHLIIIQSVLDRDVYQDVATIEVEKDTNNQIQVQVVGDVYMYGQNYIYEPVYVSTPVIYNSFWVNNYHPYISGWYWNYYPNYYSAWTPYPVYRYRKNVHLHINVHNHYNYVNVRRSQTAVAIYNGRRANAYERQYPDRSFQRRNSTNVSNRHDLEQTRNLSVRNQPTRNGATRTNINRANADRSTTNIIRENTLSTSPVRSQNNPTRVTSPTRTQQSSTRQNATTPVRSEQNITRNPVTRNTATPVRSENNATRVQSVNRTSNAAVRAQTAAPRQSAVRSQPAAGTRSAAPRGQAQTERSAARN